MGQNFRHVRGTKRRRTGHGRGLRRRHGRPGGPGLPAVLRVQRRARLREVVQLAQLQRVPAMRVDPPPRHVNISDEERVPHVLRARGVEIIVHAGVLAEANKPMPEDVLRIPVDFLIFPKDLVQFLRIPYNSSGIPQEFLRSP